MEEYHVNSHSIQFRSDGVNLITSKQNIESLFGFSLTLSISLKLSVKNGHGII